MAGRSHKDYVPEPMGRPSKFTPERTANIISAISRRVPYQLAAEANGISERTLYYWLDQGADDLDNHIESEYSDFLQGIKKAEMQKVMEHTDMIASAPERWQAHAWLLERRWNKHFGANALLEELSKRVDKLQGVKNESSRKEEDVKQDGQRNEDV